MKKIKKGFVETKTAAGLELKYVSGKKSGYKHASDLEEQLDILKIQRNEIPTLRERMTNISNHTKDLAESEAKGLVEFAKESDTPGQHPKLSQAYKAVSHNLKETSTSRWKLRATLEEVKEEWKSLETADLHELRVKQDATNRATSDQQYWTGQKKPQKAAEFEAKYKVLTAELVTLIHETRMKKEERVPGYLLRITQAQVAFLRDALREAEHLESTLRDLGPVTPIPFHGIEKFRVDVGSLEDQHDHSQSPPSHTSHSPSHATHAQPQHYAPAPTSSHQPQHYAPVPAGHAPPPIPNYPRAQGLYPFNAEQPNELSFNAGDVLTILSQEGQWWTAQLNGRTGSIPANYVKLI